MTRRLDNTLVEEVREAFVPREWSVLVAHFPPFAEVRRADGGGPLVDLLGLFGRLLNKSMKLEPLKGWPYVDLIESHEFITIAAPIFPFSRTPLETCCFCTVETCFLVASKSAIPRMSSLRKYLGEMYARCREMSKLSQGGEPTVDRLRSFSSLAAELRQTAGRLLRESGAEGYAVPSEYFEEDILRDLKFPRVKVIASGAPLVSCTRALKSKFLVVCNKLTVNELVRSKHGSDYHVAPLLRKPLVTPAGIPFARSEEKLLLLFDAFLRQGDPEIEALLASCVTDGVRVLPPSARKRMEPVPLGVRMWFEYLARADALRDALPDSSDTLFITEAADPTDPAGLRAVRAPETGRRVFRGTVVRIVEEGRSGYAIVTLSDGRSSQSKRLELARLAQAGAAFEEARFEYVVTDYGARREIVISCQETDQLVDQNERLARRDELARAAAEGMRLRMEHDFYQQEESGADAQRRSR